MNLETTQPKPRPPAAPERRPAPDRQEKPPPARQDGIRDTVESIIVAFILAFVFRAFVVEAFVIPTGSMAPGLYGRHAQHRCERCGYSFSYGLRDDAVLPDGSLQPGTLRTGRFSVRCPNCTWADGRNGELNTSPENAVSADAGDRILVLKWPYDLGGPLLGPKRWDVVVFKDPEDGETNFIKRLIGLPGEVLEIINGDIYTAPLASVPPDIRDALSTPPDPADRNRRRLSPEHSARLAKLLKIQRKTRVAQDSLWMIHYHHDYRPRLDGGGVNPDFNPPLWQPQGEDSGWDPSSPVVRFAPRGRSQDWLRLTGKPIQDTYGYNDVNHHVARQPPVDVGDVRLKFVLFPGGGQGALFVSLKKGSDEFRARIDAAGTVTLDRAGPGGVRIELSRAASPPLRPGKSVEVEFENLDYRVALRMDGEEVIATTDSQYAPNIAQLLERPYRDGRFDQAAVAIGAEGLPLELRHLIVERDVFYRSDFQLEDRNYITGRRNALAQFPGWGTANNPILLRDDPPDYFCCGDNSPQSKDSRLWWEVSPLLDPQSYQYGTVPGDQMIGRAFFVYWPGGYRLSKDTPAAIPNVGRMRIIR
jgi:signal peptidase I